VRFLSIFVTCFVQAFSGLLPFQGYRDEGVILRVMSGTRPDRPLDGLGLGLTDGIWRMMQECWGSSDRRWTISHIVSHLESSIAPTVKGVGLDEQIEPPGQLSSAPVPHDDTPSASEPESKAAQPGRRKNCFRRLGQWFRRITNLGNGP